MRRAPFYPNEIHIPARPAWNDFNTPEFQHAVHRVLLQDNLYPELNRVLAGAKTEYRDYLEKSLEEITSDESYQQVNSKFFAVTEQKVLERVQQAVDNFNDNNRVSRLERTVRYLTGVSISSLALSLGLAGYILWGKL